MAFDAAARTVQHDNVSVDSYGSDEHTLPGYYTDDDAQSTMSFSCDLHADYFSRQWLPPYHVLREQGVSQPVYEAWVIYTSHETGHESTKLTSCVINFQSTHDEQAPWVYCKAEPFEQHELSDMALASAGRYQAANKRALPSRLIRGPAKSYEQDLDRRIQKLPFAIQSKLNGLLRRREDATSNRFRRRDWTVVMMREQYRYRFASANPEEVTESVRFWKKKDRRRIEYFFVIRGTEGKVVKNAECLHQPREHGNPWELVDEYDERERDYARYRKRFGNDETEHNGQRTRPRRRSLSPGCLPRRPPPHSPQRGVDDVPPAPVRVRFERGQSLSRPRWPNATLPPFNPFAPGPASGGMMTRGPASGGFPPQEAVFRNPSLEEIHQSYSDRNTQLSTSLGIIPPPAPPPPFRPVPQYGASDPYNIPSMPQLPHLDPSVGFLYAPGSSSSTALHPDPFGFLDRGPAFSRFSPPPAPRLSNLTTPTTFSIATTNNTGSTNQDIEDTAP